MIYLTTSDQGQGQLPMLPGVWFSVRIKNVSGLGAGATWTLKMGRHQVIKVNQVDNAVLATTKIIWFNGD